MCLAKGKQDHETMKIDKRNQKLFQSFGRGKKYSATKKKKIQEIVCEDNAGTIDEQFEPLSFSEVKVHDDSDSRDEVFADIGIKVPDKPHVSAKLKVKVDTGAQGNTLPRRIYQQMCPSKVDSRGIPIPEELQQRNIVLTAYNGSHIKQYGVINLLCKFSSSDWYNTEFYVAETSGPALLGLTSSLALKLVTLNCEIQAGPSGVINSVKDLLKYYPNSFVVLASFMVPTI